MTAPTSDSVLTPDVDPSAAATPVTADAPTPNLEKTKEAVEGPAMRSVGVTVLAVLALLYTVFFARDFLLPITIAVLLDFLFSPVVRGMTRFKVPPAAGAAVVVLALVGALGLGSYQLAGPVQKWAASAPETFATINNKIRKLMRPVERVSRTAEQVASATSAAGTGAPAARQQTVVVAGPSIVSRVFGSFQRFLAGLLEVFILLYFLLASGDFFLQKLIKVLPQLSDKRTAVHIAREIEASISTYLLTTLTVNVIEGLVVTGAMWALDMPNPVLWGSLVVFLEFIPYLGAATMVLVLSIAALATFDAVGHALLVPATFLLINMMQANVVSPLLLSRRLTLNPVAIFVGLAFWWWIWGIPGAFIAVPVLATFKIFCDHIEVLAPVGEFLGKRDDDERRKIVRTADWRTLEDGSRVPNE
jgi:predicted PurR-regulated permease PerM